MPTREGEYTYGKESILQAKWYRGQSGKSDDFEALRTLYDSDDS